MRRQNSTRPTDGRRRRMKLIVSSAAATRDQQAVGVAHCQSVLSARNTVPKAREPRGQGGQLPTQL